MIPQLHSNARARQCAHHNTFEDKALRVDLMEREQISARSRIAHTLYGRVDPRVYNELEFSSSTSSPRRGGGEAKDDSPAGCSVLNPNIDTNVINSTHHQPKVITQVVIEGSDSRRVPSPTVVTQLINKRIVESRNLFLRTAGKVKPYLVVTEHTSPRGGRPPELPELPRQPLCRGTTVSRPNTTSGEATSTTTTPRKIDDGAPLPLEIAVALQSSFRISPTGTARLTSPRNGGLHERAGVVGAKKNRPHHNRNQQKTAKSTAADGMAVPRDNLAAATAVVAKSEA